MEAGMRTLIAQKNWSNTPLGHADQWPSALKTLVNVILNSKFPMFLFWGPELISFYNDAFRPSLGQDGKHPGILGKPARAAWSEIWDIIKPLLDQALRGEAVWREDLLVPFYRNGRIEDIYWTFSYSAIHDHEGKAQGVLVICNETTEKIQYTGKLRESEDRFRNIVHQAPIGITIFEGEDLTVQMANKTYLDIIGKEETEVTGKRFFDVLPELRSSVEHLLLNVLRTGEPYYGTEFKVQLKREGAMQDAYFNFVYYPLKNDSKVITGVIVVASEVTEQVKSKFKIQESESKFRDFLMSSPVPMCILTGSEFVIETANRVMVEDVWKRNRSEVVGHKLFDVFPELQDQKYAELLRRVYDTGQPHSEKESEGFVWIENKLKRLFLDYEYRPLLDVTNQVWGVIVTLSDVTEKVEARRKLEESEQKLNIVIDASELGTWEVDFKTREVTYSDRYLEILGYRERVSLTHEQIVKHIHPDDLKIREEAYKRALETGVLYYAARVIWNDGSTHWIEGKGKLFYDKDGKPDRMLGTVADITNEKNQKDVLERKVSERTRELAQKNADLERMNAELQSFAYVSSHDLQEPLRKIQILASRIRDTETLTEKGTDYFQRIKKSAHQMQTLIQDLLAYSRTNGATHVFESVDLKKLTEEVAGDFQDLLDEKNGAIETVNTCQLKVIPLQFRQVLHNLISNSLKFSKQDVPPRIIISAQSIDLGVMSTKPLGEKPYCHVSIIDNGIGFDPQYSEKIFEVFQRLHGKHEYAGTGVGLAIVKRIIENHNGIIKASGEPGKGARFDIYVPV